MHLYILTYIIAMKYGVALNVLLILTALPNYGSVSYVLYSRNTPTRELFRSYNITRFKHLYTYCVYIFLFGLQCSLTVLNNQMHEHNTRQANKLHVQLAKCEQRKEPFVTDLLNYTMPLLT